MMFNVERLILQAKTFSVDMQNNYIVLDGIKVETPNIKFSCNWSEQEIIEVLEKHTLLADHHNANITANGNRVQLPIYHYMLLRTNKHDIMSIGWYSENEKD